MAGRMLVHGRDERFPLFFGRKALRALTILPGRPAGADDPIRVETPETRREDALMLGAADRPLRVPNGSDDPSRPRVALGVSASPWFESGTASADRDTLVLSPGP